MTGLLRAVKISFPRAFSIASLCCGMSHSTDVFLGRSFDGPEKIDRAINARYVMGRDEKNLLSIKGVIYCS